MYAHGKVSTAEQDEQTWLKIQIQLARKITYSSTIKNRQAKLAGRTKKINHKFYYKALLPLHSRKHNEDVHAILN